MLINVNLSISISYQESISLSTAIALNWCSTIACIRDYRNQVIDKDLHS